MEKYTKIIALIQKNFLKTEICEMLNFVKIIQQEFTRKTMA